MKKHISIIAAIALLFACQPENNSGGTGDNGGNKEVVATAIKLNTNDLTLEKGANEVLTVTYTPSNTTKKDLTWVSTNTGIATVADGIVVGVAVGSTEIIAKCGDATDRCKVTVVIPATGIGLDKTSLELMIGDSETLVASVEPAGSTDTVVWETSDAAVATVTDGVVKAVGAGEATITAKAGDQKAECKVTVLAVPAGAVDLGIVMTREDGTKYKLYWAKSNLSTSGLCANPEDYGDYYAWGETEPYYTEGHSQDSPCSSWRSRTNPSITGYNWASYKWCKGSYSTLTKYNTKSSFGTVDNKTVLDQEDDVASVKLGGKWRMPTDAEWTELMTKCTWTWTTNYNGTGVSGRIVTAHGNSIFLPAAGCRDATDLYKGGSIAGPIGFYWSSSLATDYPNFAWSVHFDSDYDYRYHDNDRYCGLSVRPVTE